MVGGDSGVSRGFVIIIYTTRLEEAEKSEEWKSEELVMGVMVLVMSI